MPIKSKQATLRIVNIEIEARETDNEGDFITVPKVGLCKVWKITDSWGTRIAHLKPLPTRCRGCGMKYGKGHLLSCTES
jgi:hypothetical protein